MPVVTPTTIVPWRAPSHEVGVPAFQQVSLPYWIYFVGVSGNSPNFPVPTGPIPVPGLLYSTAAPLAIPSGSGWSAPGCSGNACYHIPLDSTSITSGSTLLLFFSYDSTSSNQVFSVTDDKSNTWVLDATSPQSNNKTMRVYRATNVTAATSAITVSLIAGAQNNFWQPLVLAFYNASALDVFSCNASTGTSISAGNITPTASGDLIVQAKYSTTQASQTASFTAGSQANIAWSLGSQLLGDGAASQYGVYNSTATINPTFTQAASDSYISCTVALKATTTGSVPTASTRIFLQEHDAMPKNAPNPWKAGFVMNTPGAVYLNYVGNDAIHSTGGVLDGVTSVPAPSVGWATGADFVGSNGHNHVNSFTAQFNTAPGPVTISINRAATTNDSINMIYVVPNGTTNIDVDNTGTTGNQTTGTSIAVGGLTPTRTNDIIFGFGGQFWCTSTSMSAPANAQFDAAFYSGITIDGPAQTDENNFWFHSVNSDLSAISATVQDTCTGSAGPGSPTFWASRIVAYKTPTTFTAASCSQADVQAAINSAIPGDTILVPAGTCSWVGGVTFSGITLKGAGSGPSGTVITAGSATMTKHATVLTRMSGFRFTDANLHLTVNAGTFPFRVDNNYFAMQGGNFQILINANGGVIDHNTFDGGSTSSVNDVMGFHPGGNEWSLPASFGNADSTGQQNVYVEDNTFIHLSVCMDGDLGARPVIRHNQMQSSAIVFHGTTPNDSSGNPPGGGRQFEVYNNTFSVIDTVNDNIPQGWVWVRGETGVIANNVMANNNTQQFSGKPNILLTVGCNQAGFTTYPVPFQVGQSAITASEPENPPSHPILIFGNTGAGTAVSVAGQGGTGGGTFDCSTPGTFIQLGRDYQTSNTWNWVPYTYPHPLALLP